MSSKQSEPNLSYKDLVSTGCSFTFKAILKTSPNAISIVENIVGSHLSIEKNGLTSNQSKQSKYTAVNCTAHLGNHDQLTSVYQALKAHPDVVMIL